MQHSFKADWCRIANPIALVVGAMGFTGRYLVSALIEDGFHVVAADRLSVMPTRYNDERVSLLDLTDLDAAQESLAECKPQVVFHLAGKIHADTPIDLYQTNIMVTLKLFEALEECRSQPLVVNIGSSAQYGLPVDRTVDEEQPLRPISHYGVSKVAQECLAMCYHRNRKLQAIVTRTFNLIGPSQPSSFVCSAFARQVAEIEAGVRPPVLSTGRLDTKRDFVDVRDAVQAYIALARFGIPGEVYNVCSGKLVEVGECLDILRHIARAQFSKVTDPTRLRSDEIDCQFGSPAKIHAQVGWLPKISFSESIGDSLNYWRSQINSKKV